MNINEHKQAVIDRERAKKRQMREDAIKYAREVLGNDLISPTNPDFEYIDMNWVGDPAVKFFGHEEIVIKSRAFCPSKRFYVGNQDFTNFGEALIAAEIKPRKGIIATIKRWVKGS